MLSSLLLVNLLACAPKVLTLPGPVDSIEAQPVAQWSVRPASSTAGDRVAAAAARFVGAKRLVVEGKKHRWDCSGLVEAAHAASGLSLKGSSANLWELARSSGVLHRRKTSGQVGDVVFFDDTWDRDGDRRLDDDLTHVGVIERVEGKGAYTLVHLVNGGVQRLRMDLRARHVHTDPEPPHLLRNDFLRARKKDDRRRTRYLAGELWRGFGRLWSVAPSTTRVDGPVASAAAP